jgi:hypothetical protein
MYSEELQLVKVKQSDTNKKSGGSVNGDFINRPFYFYKAIYKLAKTKNNVPLFIFDNSNFR